jgi:hypothetical protein
MTDIKRWLTPLWLASALLALALPSAAVAN